MAEIIGFALTRVNKEPLLLLVDSEAHAHPTSVRGLEALWREQRKGFPTALKEAGREPPGSGGEPLGSRGPLMPPAPLPEKIVGVGKSYAAHARELGSGVEEPDYFLISPSALVGLGEPIVLPPESVTGKVDYEGEIVLVLGREIRNAGEREAAEAIVGYTLGNDVTARDLQMELGKPWSLAKSMDTFKPLGPLVKIVGDPGELEELCIETQVSGQVMQRGCAGDMVLTPAQLVASISRYMTLKPGDLIYTGTPPGVGYARKPPRLLARGDWVRVSLTRPGVKGMVLENPVR